MAHSVALVEALKRELRTRGLTYGQVARELGLSETSVKRMFSRRDFTLKRLDSICRIANTEFSELARLLQVPDTPISALTPEQEKEIVADKRLFLVAMCVLNHISFDQLVAGYELTPAECIKLLARLDRLKFIELQPGNRIKLLISRTFSWLPNGPVQKFFNDQAHGEFFRSNFTGPDELMLVVNGMLSKASAAAIVSRLKRVAREFSDLHTEDLRLPVSERSAMSLLVATRPWELQAFSDLRRRKKRTNAGGRQLSV